MITLKNVNLPLKYNNEQLSYIVADTLKIKAQDIKSLNLKRISIDARKKDNVHYIATVSLSVAGNEQKVVSRCKNAVIDKSIPYSFKGYRKLKTRPVIVGSGPAGLFCALMLARFGERPIIIERGKPVDERSKSIDSFWKTGILDTESNVQFGEGGAGTFSDGKLNTGINDIRSHFVLKEFVSHGANEDILISAKPHIGTDILKNTIKSIREEIISLGGEFLFNTLFVDYSENSGKLKSITVKRNGLLETIDTDTLVLAIGHSARDTFYMLKEKGIAMQQKAFSIGARIEHLRESIDECQYGKAKHFLPAADYKISTQLKNGRGVYSFCMCPGGYVVNASSEEGGLCTNGMSYNVRNAENSNSAILVSVTPNDYNSGDVLDGIKLQRDIERKAFNKLDGYLAPVERVDSFTDTKFRFNSKVTPTIMPGYEYCNIADIYPRFISQSLKEGLVNLSSKISAFNDGGAILTAAETRSSSPVRIIRDTTLQSITCKGIYPCGEGAGYAGGIMSAATDGIKCAEAILSPI